MRRRSLAVAGLILAFLIAWMLLLLVWGPTRIVDWLGVERGYALLFAVAASGGLSSFSSATFYTTLGTLAAGGLNPLLLALVGGLGLSIGDTLFYWFGHHGAAILKGRAKRWMDEATAWLTPRPWLVPLVVFLYAGFTPFPNDIMMVVVALTGTRYRYVVAPLILGNAFLAAVVAFIAA